MTMDLFDVAADAESRRLPLAPGAVLLRGFAGADDAALLAAVHRVIAQAPLRHMVTPGGLSMSVAMTNCGARGWVSDRTGYRYDAVDPDGGHRWPPMPDAFRRLARDAAAAAGFDSFVPDACLINRYEVGARLSLHQDKDERDFEQPIVSVSLGVPAVFLFGGSKRSDKTLRVPVRHGDVIVWGGPSRLNYHGVLPLKAGHHAALGGSRINLTLRKAA
ncbi:MAG: DNA oxidative demethylase AlkB [Burkholderiales bacterium]|jgi:alkylated DNA repair protein (DNA oxidative demethylase)